MKNDYSFIPQLRLNVYSNREGQYYLETEKAVIIKDKPVFEAAIPFRNDHLVALADSIMAKEEIDETITVFPEDLLFMNKKKVIVYHKPQTRELKFIKSLKIKSGVYQTPGLIFMLIHNSLHVYAYKGRSRPTEDTILYKSPFYNIDDGGRICMGNNQTSALAKISSRYSAINIAITMFFTSEFAHYLDVRRLDGITLEELYREKKGILPPKLLIKDGNTLKEKIQKS